MRLSLIGLKNIRTIFYRLSLYEKQLEHDDVALALKKLLKLSNRYRYEFDNGVEKFIYYIPKEEQEKRDRIRKRMKDAPKSNWIKEYMENNKDEYAEFDKKIEEHTKIYNEFGGIPINFESLFSGVDRNLPMYVSNWYEEREHWLELMDVEFYSKNRKHSELKQCVNLLISSKDNVDMIHNNYTQLTVNDFLCYIEKIKFFVDDITYKEPKANNVLDYNCSLRGFRFFDDAVLIVVES